MVWLQGGASHLETYDPKPDAPAEVRGPVRRRSPPGRRASASASCCRCTRLSPTGSRSCDRSRTRGSATSRGTSRCSRGTRSRCSSSQPDHPDLMCIAQPGAVRPEPPGAGLCGRQPDPLPWPGLPRPRSEPFAVYGDPNAPSFTGRRASDSGTPSEVDRLGGRMSLAAQFDRLPAGVDDRMRSETLRRLPATGVHAPHGPGGAAGLRPRAGKTPASATATAGTPGASAACWRGDWSRPAWTW